MRQLAYRRRAHRLPPPPARGRRRPAAGARRVHGRERGALPGRGRGRGDRGAGLLRARLPVHATRSRSGATRSGSEQARDDLDAYCEFVRTTPLRLGLEVDFVPGAEDRIANLLDGHDFDYVVGSVHFVGDRAVDHDGYDIWETERRPRRRLAPLLRDPRRGGAQRPVRHPRPPRPGEDVGAGQAPSGARSALLLRAGGGGDRRVRHRGRGLDRRPAKAGRGDLPGAGLRRHVRRGRGRVRPLLRRPRRRRRRPRLRDARSPTMRDWGIEQIAVFERRERRLEPLG